MKWLPVVVVAFFLGYLGGSAPEREAEVVVVRQEQPEPPPRGPAPEPEDGANVPPRREEELREALADEQDEVARLNGLLAQQQEELERFRQLEYPALDHPTLALTYLKQCQLRVVFDQFQPTGEQLLSGGADRPNPEATRVVESLLGQAEADRLRALLPLEFDRHGRNHMRWVRSDPLAQKLHWYLCASL